MRDRGNPQIPGRTRSTLPVAPAGQAGEGRLERHDGPFLVLSGGQLLPIDGPLRIVELEDGWYVIGESSTMPCGSERAARDALAWLLRTRDPHANAQQALTELGLELD